MGPSTRTRRIRAAGLLVLLLPVAGPAPGALAGHAEVAAFYEEFPPGRPRPAFWSESGSVVVSDECGSFSGETALVFPADRARSFGLSARYAVTRAIDVFYGGELSFYLRFGGREAACVDPMISTFRTAVQFREGDAGAWTTLRTLRSSDYRTWTKVEIPLPFEAWTTTTRFRWSDEGAGATCCPYDWAIDDVRVAAKTLPAFPGTPAEPVARADAGSTAISVTWDPPAASAPARLTGYALQRGFEPRGPFIEVARLGTVTTWTDADPPVGVALYYRVAALNRAGQGPWSPTSAAVRATTPYLFESTFDAGALGAAWPSATGATIDEVCGAASPPFALHFSGPSTRQAVTRPVDARQAGHVSFRIRFGAGPGSCPGDTDRDVLLEYRTGATSPWSALRTYDDELYPNFALVVEPLPAAARSAATEFRWRQLGWGTGQAWALDDVLVLQGIEPFAPAPPTPPPSAPLPPTQLDVSAFEEPGKIFVGWNPAPGATTYRVERSTSGLGPFTAIRDTSGLSLRDTGLTEGIAYFYRVRSLDGTTASEPGPIESAVSPQDDRTWEDGFYGGAIAAFWDTTSGAVKDGDCGQHSWENALRFRFYAPGEIRRASTDALDLTGDGWLRFWIQLGTAGGSCRSDGEEDVVLEYSTGGAWTELLRFPEEEYERWRQVELLIPPGAQTTATRLRWRTDGTACCQQWMLDDVEIQVYEEGRVPDAPSNFDVEVFAPGQVRVSWANPLENQALDVVGARVYRRDIGSSTFALLHDGPAAGSYLDSGLVAGRSYDYRVAAYNDAGEGAWTEEHVVRLATEPPKDALKPTGAFHPETGRVELKWAASFDPAGREADHYSIRRGPAEGPWEPVARVRGHTFSELAPEGAPHTYFVVPVNAAGEGPWGAPAVPIGHVQSFVDRFERASLGPDWTNGGMFLNGECGSVSPTRAAGHNGRGGDSMESKAFNTTAGGRVSFQFRVGGGDFCSTTGAVKFQLGYQLPGMEDWDWEALATIQGDSSEGFESWRAHSYDIPAEARSSATRFRWKDGPCVDIECPDTTSWVIDDVEIFYGAWDPVPPSPPRHPIAESGPGSGQVTLRWDAPFRGAEQPGAEFVIHRATEAGGPYAMHATSRVPDGFIDSAALPGTTYYYRVATRSPHGTSALTDEIMATPQDLGRPGGFTAQPGPGLGGITVRWTPPTVTGGRAIVGYELFRSAHPDELPKPIRLGAVDRFPDSGLPPGSKFYYHVRAVTAVGAGPLSLESSAMAAKLPTAPTQVTSTTGPARGEITVSWEPPTDYGGLEIDGYVVYAETADGALETLARLEPRSTFIDSGLADGETRTYRVAAFTTAGEGPPSPSTTQSAGRLAGPARNVHSKPGPGGSEITLTWDPPKDEGGLAVTGFVVHAGADPGTLARVAEVGRDFVWRDRGLAPGQTRHYAVASLNAAGEGSASAPLAAPGPALPGTPETLVATRGHGPGEIALRWSRPGSTGGLPVDHYEVSRGIDSGDMAPIATLEPNELFDSGLAPDTTYTYAVRAATDAGMGPAATVDVRSPSAPGPPDRFTVKPGAVLGEVVLRWYPPLDDGGTRARGYRVYRVDNAQAVLLAELGDERSYRDLPSLTDPVARFEYRVSAVNGVGEGAWVAGASRPFPWALLPVG